MSHEQPLRIRSVAIVLTIIGTALALGPFRPLFAQETPDDLAALVNARIEGDLVERTLTMTRTSRSGSVQEREAVSYRSNDDAGARRSLLVYTAPRAIRGTAFLTHDEASGADRRWLFLPQRGNAMRIPDAQRGKAFLGTGFSYEDLKSELKLSPEDYAFEAADAPTDAAPGLAWIRAVPHSAKIAKELGYGDVTLGIDTAMALPRDLRFTDRKGKALKRVTVPEAELIDGVPTALVITAEHHQKGHSTTFAYGDVAYGQGRAYADLLPEEMERALP